MQFVTRALPSSARRRAAQGLTILGLATLLAGCGLFGSSDTAPTAIPTRTPFPTFTSTPVAESTPTATPAPAQPQAAATSPVAPTAETPPTATPAPPTPPAAARLTVTSDLVNVRSGPGTDFGLVGTAATGESFEVTGRNEAGDWWQICCVNGQPGWVFGELATVENAAAVQLAADLPGSRPGAGFRLGGGAHRSPGRSSCGSLRPAAPTAAPRPPAAAPAPAAPYDPTASSAGNFDPNAQYQIVHFKVLGLDENNGGIRDSSSQHLIFLTVLDQGRQRRWMAP